MTTMMKFAAIALLIFASPAMAGEVVVHLGSVHGRPTYVNGGKSVVYNNFNPGVGYRFDSGASIGVYHNSYRRPTLYVGYTKLWDTGMTVGDKPIRAGGIVSILTGYEIATGNKASVGGAFVIGLGVSNTRSVYLLHIPKINSDTVSVTHLAIGHRF